MNDKMTVLRIRMANFVMMTGGMIVVTVMILRRYKSDVDCDNDFDDAEANDDDVDYSDPVTVAELHIFTAYKKTENG
jgi:hypothetical protein